ncbi:hypothetical protein DP1662 [Desulfotalea psychrophila LSv54]|uniref:DUF559 domain-containing protein n=1 Tax=Desulfotalea psychrophila (strain LSv54 / DSM 12343) TaxID=177439 RepID=Q6AMN4_DESPS|nr:DUF559 domain-containing protein [Desulfotalea psychrophila]CAG36391.1 hypothetical protein DP1662 [Desulfotalea psychrophila LSv54]
MAAAPQQAVGGEVSSPAGHWPIYYEISPEQKLVIELDGDSHWTEEAQDYDRQRDSAMRAVGLRVLRLSNHDVMHNIEGVLFWVK